MIREHFGHAIAAVVSVLSNAGPVFRASIDGAFRVSAQCR
jgi:hypothetical protein